MEANKRGPGIPPGDSANKRPRAGPASDSPPPEVDPDDEFLDEECEGANEPQPPPPEDDDMDAPELGEAARGWPRPDLKPIDPNKDSLGEPPFPPPFQAPLTDERPVNALSSGIAYCSQLLEPSPLS